MKSSQSISGILKSLKRQEISWQEKVKLIHKILSNTSFLPNKHQILLDWTSQELVNNATKGIYSQEMIQELWQILVEIVKQSQQKNIKGKFFLTLRPGLIEAFTKAFRSEEWCCMALVDCCTIVFDWPEICKPLTTKFDKFVILVANVLKCLTQKLISITDAKEETDPKCVNELIGLVDVLLQSYRRLERQQSDPQQVFVVLCENLLHQMAIFKHLTSRLKEEKHKTIGSQVEKLYFDIAAVFQGSLWTRENLEGMKKSLDSVKEKIANTRENDRQKKKVSCLESLVSAIQSGLKFTDTEPGARLRLSMLDLIPEIFQSMLEVNRQNITLQNKHEFAFFKKISQTISEATLSSQNQDNLSCYLIRCRNDLLENISTFGVFKVNDDSVNSIENASFLECIASDAVLQLSSSCCNVKLEVYRCFQLLLKINSLLITPHITTLLKELIVQSTADTQEGLLNAQKKEELLNCLLERYGKARQIEKFLQFLIVSVEDAEFGECRIFIPESSMKRLTDISSILPIGQTLSVTQMLLNEMDQSVKSISVSLDGAESHQPNQDAISQAKKLLAVASLYEIFATNAHVFPHGGHTGANQQSYVNASKSLHDTVVQPLMVIFHKISSDAKLKHDVGNLVWKLVVIFEKIQLFLLQHGLISEPLIGSSCYQEMLLSLLRDPNEKLNGATYLAQTFAVILCLKTSMFISDDSAVTSCLEALESSTTFFLKTSLKDQLPMSCEESSAALGYLEVIMKELPWLGNLLGSEAIARLNELLFAFLKVTTSQKDASSSISLSTSADPGLIGPILSSAHFYDNLKMQEAFCGLLARKVNSCVSLENETATSKLIENLNSIAARQEATPRVSHDSEEEAMDCEDDNESMTRTIDCSTSRNGLSLSEGEKEQFLLILKDFWALPLEENRTRESRANEFNSNNVLMYLRTVNSLRCEWLLQRCKIRLLFAILLVQRELLVNTKKSELQSSTLASTFRVLSKLAFSDTKSHSSAAWEAVDPAAVLHWLLKLIEKFKYQDELPVDEICDTIKRFSRLLLKIKRPKEDDVEINKLAEKVLQTCELSIKSPSKTTLHITNSILSVAFETISSPAKKYSLISATKIIHPVMKLLLSVDPVANAISFGSNFEDPSLLDICSHTYVICICISMKLSRKHPHLVALQQDLNWANHFHILLDIIKKMIADLCSKFESKELSKSAEKVCIECLQLFYSLEDIDETSQLRNVDFSRQVFLGLLSLAENHYKNDRGNFVIGPYNQVMNDILNHSTDVNQEILLNDVITKLEASYEESSCALVCLEFLNDLLALKKAREKQRPIKKMLPMLIYICIDVISKDLKSENDFISLVAYNVIVKILGFTKGMINNSHCIATLHLYALERKPTNTRSFQLFIARVNLLSNLLFNHADGVYPAISSFIIAVKSLLIDLALLHEDLNNSKSVKTEACEKTKIKLIRACEKMSRLYQEIASHKQTITKYAPHLIADYLKMVTTNCIAEEFQNYLVTGVHCIMDACSEHEFALLNMHLAQGDREMFKELHKEYNKHYKFQGKA